MEANELNWAAIVFWGVILLAIVVGIVQCGVEHVRTYRAEKRKNRRCV